MVLIVHRPPSGERAVQQSSTMRVVQLVALKFYSGTLRLSDDTLPTPAAAVWPTLQ